MIVGLAHFCVLNVSRLRFKPKVIRIYFETRGTTADDLRYVQTYQRKLRARIIVFGPSYRPYVSSYICQKKTPVIILTINKKMRTFDSCAEF